MVGAPPPASRGRVGGVSVSSPPAPSQPLVNDMGAVKTVPVDEFVIGLKGTTERNN